MNGEPSQPDLEALLAAEEASIRDDGFSKQVIAAMDAAPGLRRITIYGAGLMGFGFAVGSLPALVRALPPLQTALDRTAQVADLTRLPDLASLSSGSQTTILVLGAAAAMILTSLALIMQER